MAEKVGWRNFWWLNVGLFAFTFLSTAFLFPETKWHRAHPGELHQTQFPQAAAKPTTVDSIIKSAEDVAELEHSQTTEVTNEQFPDLEYSETAAKDPFLGKGAPSRKSFKPWQPADPHSSVWDEISTPWKLLALPIVEFASFIVSWSASCFLMVNLTQSQNFAAPPYNYSSLTIGK
jgi:hypothetical protein